MLEELGFTTTAGILWNSFAYLAFAGIIYGVLWAKHYQAELLTICPAILGVYAGVFLHNWLLTALQAVVTTSGILLWSLTEKKKANGILLSVGFLAQAVLILTDQLKSPWDWVGMFGLALVALGLVNLPFARAYWIMNAGAVLLVVYGYHAKTWVWFLLNIFFVFANFYSLIQIRHGHNLLLKAQENAG